MFKKLYQHQLLILISIIYLLVGFFTYRDYGIGIEEHFQRSSGFHWLNFILESTNFDSLKIIVKNKILEINDFTPDLPSLDIANYYGILFDVPTAFFESLFNIKNPQSYFYFRHLVSFIIFFLSGIFFYKILLNRFSNIIISFFGTTMYSLSPKIYGNSFFDNKDLFFLSILTITFFFYLKYEKEKTIINLFFFALFSAFATSSRIFGLMVPITFFILLFFESITSNNKLKILKKVIIFLIFFITILYAHWPYMWTLNISNIFSFFSPFKVYGNFIVFFDGNFYDSNHLPLKYIPKWIFISTPVYILLLFFIGYIKYFKRIIFRFSNIKINSLNNDLWKSKNEKYDLIFFLSLFQVIAVYLSFDINLVKGWTHFLFLNLFLIYFASLGIYQIKIFLNKNKNILKILYIIFLIFTFEIIYKLIIYHPYQSLYFNNLVNDKSKSLYEIDYQSLSRSEAIRDILNDSEKDIVNIATASWTPLKNGLSILEKSDKVINFTGTANKKNADYIFTNHYYEVDVRYNDKYKIPENFNIFKVKYIDGIKVFSIYKKKY
jgi:hypothetical protein